MNVAITRTAALSGAGASPGAEQPLANPRARKTMSRAAYLAARCLAELLRDTRWPRDGVGYFLGVGGSGGSLDDIMALLEASIGDGTFSLPRFGDRGLAACNPLLAFQLMNNFTMCHGAILEGLRGPNGAVFSRGAGTIAAISEAVHAVRTGECEHAIAGGADAATHPVTVAELSREGFIARGLVPADGAGLVAIGAASSNDDVIVEGCAHASGAGRPVGDAIDDAIARARLPGGAVDVVVLSPWGPPAADALRSHVSARYPSATVSDVSGDGETLAASAALAVIAGVARLATAPGRVVVLTLGVDGDPGIVVLSRGAR
ncbi:MAG: beta-ketoacyl synthase N-terminal-like domain-containing protein [Acidobacteriota bacterium]